MKRILAFLILPSLMFASAAMPWLKHSRGPSGGSGGGGGGGAWTYIEESTFNGVDSNLAPSTITWSEITLPSGNATKLSIRIDAVSFAGTIRLVIYSNAGSKLAEAVTSSISTTGWHDVTISSTAVSSGTYKVAYLGQDNDALDVSYNLSTGTTYYEAGQSGGNAPSTLPTPLGNFTGRPGFRVWVE